MFNRLFITIGNIRNHFKTNNAIKNYKFLLRIAMVIYVIGLQITDTF